MDIVKPIGVHIFLKICLKGMIRVREDKEKMNCFVHGFRGHMT